MSILINVVNQKMYMSSTMEGFVAGSQQFVKFQFNLTDEWDGLLTFAQFRQSGKAYNQYLDEDNCVYLPPEIGVGTCTLMLYGSHDTTIGTTNYLTLHIDENILISDADSTEISESLYNQLVTKINAITSWNDQGIADIEAAQKDLQIQINRKAAQSDLISEISRAKAAETANANAIALKADQSQVDDLQIQVNELANNEVIAELIENAVVEEMSDYLASGQLANLTIQDGSISRAKVDADFESTLSKAETAMQPNVYDTQGLQVDVYSYAQGRADMVQYNLDEVKNEIADAYTLTDTLKYQKLGDALRGSVALSRSYMQALLAEYNAFTIEIVDELPTAGASQTFYLIPKDSGNGYDKYWYITDEVGNKTWDVFGGSSTLVVESLPEVGEPDVDYILKTTSGYLYYKYIEGYWEIIAGSLAYVGSALPSKDKGSEFTDYYIVNQDSGAYTHYRYINGEFRVIGGDSYTKDQINEMISAFQESVDKNAQNITANTTNIQSLSSTVTQLQQEMKNLDVEGYTYYATYGKATLLTGDEADNVFTLWECKDGKEEVKSQFIIAGGGGGGGTTTTTNLVVDRITASPIIATPTDKVEIKINYSSTDSDGELIDGTYTWKLGSSTIMTGALVQGENTFDMTEYVSVGTQKFTLTVVDEGGSVNVKSWTVQVVDVRLESVFSDKITYPAGKSVNFTYTPYGSVSKTVHFILDGVELDTVTTSASGTLQSYSLPAQTHGAHLLECYITATVNSMEIETEHIFKDIMWFDENSDTPIIGCIYRYDHYGKVTSRQYNTTNITYYVVDPKTGTPTVTHTADGSVVATETLSTSSNVWTYKTDVIGDHNLVISCRGTSVEIVMDITELGIDVSPVTANLAFDFNPTGLSNTGTSRLWSDANTGVNMTVSDNFDWTNGGYQLDSDGNQYFCVKAGTRAVINYKLFEQDASLYGSEFKIIFKATNVRDANATFLSCQADSTVVGLEMKAHAAYFKTSATGDDPLYIPYSEDDIIEMELNINTLDTDDATATSVIMSYEDGVGFRPLIYDAAHRLYQYNPVPITIGSDDCDIHIYRMKAYTASLSDTDILSNFIADSRDSDTMLARYDRNQIYNENNALTPEFVASACPDLKIIKIDCPYFTQDKKEIIKNTTIECIHKNGDPILDNWKAINGAHSGQGTTSNEYGYAGRNLNIYMCFDGVYKNKNTTFDPDYKTELTMGDGTKYANGTGKVSLTRTSVPNALFNIKTNIASSENANNALLQNRFHEFLPYTTVGSRRDPNAKTTMEFVNCVVFVRENNTDISTHREFQDNDWHFYAIGNMGDSKDTDATRTNDPDDHNEFVIEIADNTKPNSVFPSGITNDGGMVYPISGSQWVAGNTAYDNLHNNWDESYEFRYKHPDITDEEKQANINVWNEFYKWVVTSTDEEFVSELGNWMIEESALYMYLFTERYTMVDNRAKNTFWHYGKVYITQAEAATLGDKASWFTIDDDAAAIHNGYRFDFWNYDNDTALGINNSGEMTMTYGKEDTDYRTDGDPNSGYIFNAAESVFFCRIRDLMYSKLQAMYLNRESAGAWSSSGLISQFDNWQNQFCEELWKLDIERKYYRTYQGGTRRFLETMMNGRKKYHRRQWERDQEAYMGTKYVSASVKADQIMFRCNTPSEAVVTPNYDLHIVPYSDMYLSVLYGNSATPMQIRAKAGVEYEIKNPLSGKMDDTAILIYCSSKIQALNDLSGCYIHDNDFTKASKLQKLIIGNSTEGYSNSFLTDLNIGNNALLQELNVRNCPNLVGSVNLTSCGNLETFYAEGTAITGVIFAPNGKIAVAHLPDTINSLTMRNLKYLTDLQVSYDNLESLTEENSVVDEYAIVLDAVDTLQTLRLTGIDWTIPDSTLLNQILKMNNAVLSGKVYISGAVRNQELANYAAAWSDLEVTYDPTNLVTQYLITYVNSDDKNTVLYKTYVDRGSTPPDPYAEGLIDLPTLESDEQYEYSFGTKADDVYVTGSGWNEITSEALQDRTVTAVYTKSVRSYTVTWYSRAGLSLGSVNASYGSEAIYPGDTPTNDTEESTYVYNVFTGWDKSTGYIRGDTDVYAVWDRAELPVLPSAEGGKSLENMSEGEINAVIKSGKTDNYFVEKDYTDIVLGHDFDFSPKDPEHPVPGEIKSEVIAENLYLDGSTAQNTNIYLFGEKEQSFTMAIDFQFLSSDTNNTLLSSFCEDGSEGFRLRFNGYPNIQWGDKNSNVGNGKLRDMVVLRHRKGENKLYIYASNGQSSQTRFDAEISAFEITRARSTSHDRPITLGGVYFPTDNGFDDYGKGIIHWCKIWYDDLGDANARQLAAWCHEPIRMEYYGSKRYRLSGGTSQRCSASFICNHLLAGRFYWMNSTNTNVGGWDESLMRTFLNTRFYNALPTVWKSMLKKVKISATAGNQSSEILVSEDYVYIPCLKAMSNGYSAPYSSEGDYITWYTSNQTRAKFMGRAIKDSATYYSVGEEPSTISSNNVKAGDVWVNTNKDSVCYMYVEQAELDKFGITPDFTASIGGGWVSAKWHWLRSPNISYSTYFWFVTTYGGCSGNVAYDSGGVCPCFSI